MEIINREDLRNCLNADAFNFQSQISSWKKRLKCIFLSTPISEQKHIWAYIKHMRYVEYYGTLKKKSKIFLIPYLHYLSKLRKESQRKKVLTILKSRWLFFNSIVQIDK